MQPEGKLVRDLRTYLEKQGDACFKIHGGDNPFQAAGIPDLLCCILGRFVGIEAKMPGGRVSPIQQKRLQKIYDAGGIAAVVESVGQLASLRSYIEKEVNTEVPRTHTGMLFYRGNLKRNCLFK
jgi:hypothetical protein